MIMIVKFRGLNNFQHNGSRIVVSPWYRIAELNFKIVLANYLGPIQHHGIRY